MIKNKFLLADEIKIGLLQIFFTYKCLLWVFLPSTKRFSITLRTEAGL